MSRARVVVLSLTAALVMSGACGSSKPHVRAAATTTTSVDDSSSTSTTLAANNGHPTTTVAKGGATTTVAGGVTTTTSPPLPQGAWKSTVTFGKACLNPGGLQTITVRTRGDAVVTYTSIYSDNTSHGDNGGGIADSSGKFVDQYAVHANAPRGKVTITAESSKKGEGQSIVQASFMVGC